MSSCQCIAKTSFICRNWVQNVSGKVTSVVFDFYGILATTWLLHDSPKFLRNPSPSLVRPHHQLLATQYSRRFTQQHLAAPGAIERWIQLCNLSRRRSFPTPLFRQFSTRRRRAKSICGWGAVTIGWLSIPVSGHDPYPSLHAVQCHYNPWWGFFFFAKTRPKSKHPLICRNKKKIKIKHSLASSVCITIWKSDS